MPATSTGGFRQRRTKRNPTNPIKAGPRHLSASLQRRNQFRLTSRRAKVLPAPVGSV